jgi:exonuclease V
LDKGRAVHKVLEKDVMGDAEPVKVEVGGKEEWWALRLLNTIVCLETLIATGRAVSFSFLAIGQQLMDTRLNQREIPVVGFVGEFLVFGVIDEVDRRELPSPRHPAEPSSSSTHPPATPVSKKPSPAARTATVSPKKAIPAKEDPQRTLDPFFSPVPSPTRKGKEKAVDQDSSPRPPHLEATVPRWGFVLSDTKTRFVFGLLSLATHD